MPRPLRPVQRWFQERESPYAWEQDGLDHVKQLMPGVEPYRAWATFSFIAPSSRVHECDLFIATPGGLYLVELKGHPGRVVNSGSTWTFFGPDRPRTMRNPLSLTDWKSKELKARLIWAAKECGFFSVRVPRIEPAVFLSAPDLESHLDTVQQTRVYGRNDRETGLGRIWDDLLGTPPEREPIREDFSKRLPPPPVSATTSPAPCTPRLPGRRGWPPVHPRRPMPRARLRIPPNEAACPCPVRTRH